MSIDAKSTRFDSNEELDLAGIILSVWARKWLVFCVTAIFGIGAAVYAFVAEPIYRATIVLVPANAGNSNVAGSLGSLRSLESIASLAGLGVSAEGSEVDEALAVLQSRQFLEQFITDKSLLPVLYRDEWDAAKQYWKTNSTPPTLAQAHKLFIKDVLFVDRNSRSTLISVSVEWADPERAAEWANELVARLNSEMRERALAKANNSLDYLEEELNRTSLVGAQAAITGLIEAQINQRMVANVVEEYAFRVVDPATTPDSEDPVRPRKASVLAIGFVVGCFLGIMLALTSTLFVTDTEA